MNIIREAINELVPIKSDNMLGTIRITYGRVVIAAANYQYDIYNEEADDDKAKEVELFIKLFRKRYSSTFNTAQFQVNERREIIRLPENLPSSANIARVLEKCEDNMCSLTSKSSYFTQVRRSLLFLLTFSNARRGGEVARMTFKNAEEALNNTWKNSTEEFKELVESHVI